MQFITFYKKNRDKWWGLPLYLPLLLLPVAQYVSTFTNVNGGVIALYYLPLALLISLMLFFGWGVIPGMVLGISLVLSHDMTLAKRIVAIFYFLIPVILSWGGYRIFVLRRHHVYYGCKHLMVQRLFWQMLFPATVFQFLLLFSVFFNVQLTDFSLSGPGLLTKQNLINYQALVVSCLTGVPLCYLVIRVIRNPPHLRAYFSQLCLQTDAKVTRTELVVWSLLLLVIMGWLILPVTSPGAIFTTNYTLSLLLPMMLWGALRFGYRLMNPVWTLSLIVCIHFYYRYMPEVSDYSNQLAITSSSYLVFSLIAIYMSILATEQRTVHARIKRMAFIDPVVNLPNLWALSRRLSETSCSVLCFLRIPELELLGCNYGVMFRIQYQQALSQWLEPRMSPGESVYHLSGHDLAIRLNTDCHETRIQELSDLIRRFRFIWDGIPLQPNVGFGYCHVRSPVLHLPMLLGELSTIASLSLVTCAPESLRHRNAIHLQQRQRDKVLMMNQIQIALEEDRFCLLAQPILGIRGDSFYEILLRLQGDEGELFLPEDFLPVASEFGLSSRIDLWVLEHTLRFMDTRRSELPALRLAINISSSSACGIQFPKTVADMLARYRIEPWQLIFELTESQPLSHPGQAQHNMEQLQALGCCVAIDDFGSGYASYSRLKSVNADILKIDGSFIQNLVSSPLDYQIVESICHVARMKKMRVVAEHVESPEIREAALGLGIDYLQGFEIGKPAPLETLVGGSVMNSGCDNIG